MSNYFWYPVYLWLAFSGVLLLNVKEPVGGYFGAWLGLMVALYGVTVVEFVIRAELDSWGFFTPMEVSDAKG